jgi:hypothetical protein
VTDLARLQAQADEKRARLARTLRSLEKRATFFGLVDDVIVHTGGAPRADDLIAALRRNPFLAIGLAVCTGLLVLEVNKVRKHRRINGRGRSPGRTAHLLTPSETKEPHHGR